jgi:hypothetical protein
MRDASNWDGAAGQSLGELALRYLRNELPERTQTAFEQRLGEEQAAREALCEAVQRAWGRDGVPLRPGPGYRNRVHARLQRTALPPWPTPHRKLSIRPIFLGAAAVLLLAVLGVRFSTLSRSSADRHEADPPSLSTPAVSTLHPPSRLARTCAKMKQRPSHAACSRGGSLRQSEGGSREREDREDG